MNPMEHGVIVNEPPTALSNRQVALLAATTFSQRSYTVEYTMRLANQYLEWLEKESS